MLVGLSYSACLIDIIEGKVKSDDVLIIIARTDFDPHIDEQWKEVWNGYIDRIWYEYKDRESDFRGETLLLYNSGKIHQPRKYGQYQYRSRYNWLETCLPNSELTTNPAAKKAWDSFQVIAGLTNVTLDKDFH